MATVSKLSSLRVRVQKLANTVANVGEALMNHRETVAACAEFRKFAEYCDFLENQIGAHVAKNSGRTP